MRKYSFVLSDDFNGSRDARLVFPSIDVLVVEDDESLRRGLELALGQEGFAVYSASCVKEACALLDTFIFDVMIVDLYLPDGTAALLLSANAYCERVPKKILVTGAAQFSQAVSELHSHFDACLFKPLHIDLLVGAIRSTPTG